MPRWFSGEFINRLHGQYPRKIKLFLHGHATGSEGAQTSLQEAYRPDMTLDEAATLALSTLKAVMEEKVSASNVDIAVVAPTYRLFTQAQVQEVIDRL